MKEPKRYWWARPKKLCALERPGGGGRSHRPERRRQEIEWLKANGVHTVISTMKSRHNLDAYQEAGLRWFHLPGDTGDEEALCELLIRLRRELRRGGAVAVHANRHTDYVTAACVACVYELWNIPLDVAVLRAEEAGMTITDEALSLVGVDPLYV